jgi:hypothetical protein
MHNSTTKKLIISINELIFVLGGYGMLISWWVTLPTTMTFSAYIMTACVLFGIVYGGTMHLYSTMKRK